MPEVLPKTTLGAAADLRRMIVGLRQMADQKRDGKPFDRDHAGESLADYVMADR